MAAACAWPGPVPRTTSCWTRVDAGHGLGDRAAQTSRPPSTAEASAAAWPLIGAIAGPLHQPQILDVARQRGLEVATTAQGFQSTPELLLVANRLLSEQSRG